MRRSPRRRAPWSRSISIRAPPSLGSERAHPTQLFDDAGEHQATAGRSAGQVSRTSAPSVTVDDAPARRVGQRVGTGEADHREPALAEQRPARRRRRAGRPGARRRTHRGGGRRLRPSPGARRGVRASSVSSPIEVHAASRRAPGADDLDLRARGLPGVDGGGRRRLGGDHQRRGEVLSKSGPVGGHPAVRVEQDAQRLTLDGPSRSRTVRRGRSARAVPGPTTTAWDSARSRCTSARASIPVIHCELPSAAAVRPSMLIAVFSNANARPVRRWCRYGASIAWTASAPTPTVTSMPASAEPGDPGPRDLAVRVLERDHDPGHAGRDQGLGARRGVAEVVARLERDVGGRAPRPGRRHPAGPPPRRARPRGTDRSRPGPRSRRCARGRSRPTGWVG